MQMRDDAAALLGTVRVVRLPLTTIIVEQCHCLTTPIAKHHFNIARSESCLRAVNNSHSRRAAGPGRQL